MGLIVSEQILSFQSWSIQQRETSMKKRSFFHYRLKTLENGINGSRGYKTFSCSTQLSMNFFLFINIKMPTDVGILTYMNRKNSILSLSEPVKI